MNTFKVGDRVVYIIPPKSLSEIYTKRNVGHTAIVREVYDDMVEVEFETHRTGEIGTRAKHEKRGYSWRCEWWRFQKIHTSPEELAKQLVNKRITKEQYEELIKHV